MAGAANFADSSSKNVVNRMALRRQFNAVENSFLPHCDLKDNS
jgi:hypothetical protein